MRPLSELINNADPGWPLVQKWISKAKNKVQVLPANRERASEALLHTQVTTRSPMGAILYETGGILIDGGWIRILGSGSKDLERSLPDWNKGKTFADWGETPGYLLVADDAVGGFFAVNGGGLGTDPGMVYYLSPDQLDWEPLSMNYSQFLNFCFSGNLKKFYYGLRWKTWESDLETLGPDQCFSFYPYLWTKEGSDIETVLKRAAPVEEEFLLKMDMRKQAGK